jgi:hypothetical protein
VGLGPDQHRLEPTPGERAVEQGTGGQAVPALDGGGSIQVEPTQHAVEVEQQRLGPDALSHPNTVAADQVAAADRIAGR